MKKFFSLFLRNLIGCFSGRMLLGHLFAIVITALLVLSGFDARFYSATRDPVLFNWAFYSAPVGGLLPLVLPLILFLAGILVKNPIATMAGWAIAQAELIGSLVSSGYKAFTGRIHPVLSVAPDPGRDLSHGFRFGFLRGGVFWGWPSSHTTIAFAMALTVFTLFPRQKWLGICAILYAFCIGIGVSMTIHWFSDFVAGMAIGTIIGIVVGRSFSAKPMI